MVNHDYSEKLKEYLSAYAKKTGQQNTSFSCRKNDDSYTVIVETQHSKESKNIRIDTVNRFIETHDTTAENKILGIIFRPPPKQPHVY